MDRAGTAIEASDRRFIQSVGPFTMQPGDTQEIVFGIVWSQDEEAAGTDEAHLASVAKLKQDDLLAQQVFDLNFQLPDPPDAPKLEAAELDQRVILSWSYAQTSNNFLGAYQEVNPLISDVPDVTFDFEGFVLWRRPTQGGPAQIVAVYDKVNGITKILQENPDGTVVVDVNGSDSGLKWSAEITNLTNYTQYDFGIQAYAYNEFSSPKTYKSPINWITVVPSKEIARDGGSDIKEEFYNASPDTVLATQAGQGSIAIRVINPALVTGDDYEVSFREVTVDDGDGHTETYVVYDIINTTTNTVLLDGETFLRSSCGSGEDFSFDNCMTPPLGEAVFSAEGLEFDVLGPAPAYTRFETVANAAGPIAGEEGAAADFQGFPSLRPSDAQQVGEGHWMIHTGDNGSRGSFDAFVDRTTNSNFASRIIGPYDFEIRFTEEGSVAYDPFCTGFVTSVPFELWRIGVGTPDDPSDDVRMAVYLLDNDFTSYTGYNGLPAFNLNSGASIQAAIDNPDLQSPCATFEADHTGSSLGNDPQTDWWYWATPTDLTPGESGYQAWADAATGGDPDFGYGYLAVDNSIRRMVLFNWNGGDVCPDTNEDGVCEDAVYNQDMPEVGTVFRITTAKPNQPGDTFAFSTAGFEADRGNAVLASDALEQIGIVPNPYKGASDYEVSVIQDVVRFTNLPSQATIRVFTLNGTHIRTLEKDGPETFLNWDLQTKDNLPVASGMYLIHVDVPGVGEKVLKFGVVKKRVFLNEL